MSVRSLPIPRHAGAEPAGAGKAAAAEIEHGASRWREHDLMIRRFHHAALAPDEIAVVLNSKGLRVRTWHVSESFVRNRLKALEFSPNSSRLFFMQGQSRYRPR